MKKNLLFVLLALCAYHLYADEPVVVLDSIISRDPKDDLLYKSERYTYDEGARVLKYIEWDGQSFQQGKRRAQSGTYPWPKGESGRVVEISEKEFTNLLSRSIVPFKSHKKDI